MISFYDISIECRHLHSPSMLSLKLVIFVGCWPSGVVLATSLFVLIFIPYIIYHLYQSYRERGEHARQNKLMLQCLISTPFNSDIMKGTECPICFITYVQNDSSVTPLPCNALHFFHTECIKHWFTEKH